MRTVYFTICSANYLSHALTLRASLLNCDPLVEFQIILADEHIPQLSVLAPGVKIIPGKMLRLKNYYDMAFRYNIVEFNTALKAQAFLDIFADPSVSKVIYLDPDIQVFQPLTHVTESLDDGGDAVVTPHLTMPLRDGKFPDDRRHLQTGIYNLGFLALRRSNQTLAFLEWWAENLVHDCRIALEQGIFVDQKYCDLLTCFMDRVKVLRHPGYNVAYWNLPHRRIHFEGSRWLVNNKLLHFFHFSGFDPEHSERVSKHQDRYKTASAVANLESLFSGYLAELSRNGHPEFSRLPYAYGRLTDGTTIIQEMRKVYALGGEGAASSYEEAFKLRVEAFEKPTRAIRVYPGVPITELMYEVWAVRQDLQKAYPLTTRRSQEEFLHWFAETARREHNVPEKIVRTTQRAAARLAELTAGGGASNNPDRWKGLREFTDYSFKMKRLRQIVTRYDPGVLQLYRRLPHTLRKRLNWWIFRDPVDYRAYKRRNIESVEQAASISRPKEFSSQLEPGACLYGFLKANTGVGEAGRRTYLALRATKYPIMARSMTSEQDGNHVLDGDSDQKPRRRINIFQINADNTIRLPDLVLPSEIRGRYNIGYWAWELPRFPAAWVEALNHVDEIWAPSEFVRHAIAQVTDKPVLTMRHPVPPVTPDPAYDRRYFGIDPDAVVVLVAVDLNSYLERKNPIGGIKAFRAAFGDNSRSAQLVVKMQSGTNHAASRQAVLQAIDGASDVIVIDRVISRDEMNGLQACCDVFLSMHRSEGFGLNIAECMSLGKLVVGTNFSGSQEFLDSDCGVPIGFCLVPVPSGAYPFGDGQWWAEPDLVEAAEALRRAVRDPGWRRDIGARAAAQIAERLGPVTVGTTMRNRLVELEAAFFEGGLDNPVRDAVRAPVTEPGVKGARKAAERTDG